MTKRLPLTKGFFATVDDADYEYLSQWKWSYSSGYAIRKQFVDGKPRRIYMHRFIANPPAGFEVDHIDRNKLNNCRSNLRICTRSENARNVSRNKKQFRGVSQRTKNSWQAQIMCLGKMFNIGNFRTGKEAAHAYDAKAKELHGDFAVLNFPEDSP